MSTQMRTKSKSKEDAKMKKRLIAAALIIVMLLALSACGKKEETASPAPEAQPQAQAQTQAQPQAQDQPEEAAPEAAPAEEPVVIEPAEGIEPDSGVYPFKSDVNGMSFDYDSKYVAMQNQTGNAVIYATGEAGVPFCSVSIIKDTDAVSYLKSISEGAADELGKNMKQAAGEPEKVPFGDRDICYVLYTYSDKEVGGVVRCVYYAENLADGSIVVYNSTSLEDESDDVDAILKLAISSFKIGE